MSNGRMENSDDTMENANINTSQNKIYQYLRGSALEYVMYPRCEFYTRFNGTCLYEMPNPKHWRSYFRSTGTFGICDRVGELQRKENQQTDCTRKINEGNSPFSKIGIIKSPFRLSPYKLICGGNENENSSNNHFAVDPEFESNSYLYDELLEYKCHICGMIIEQYLQESKNLDKSNIEVYYQNSYPCIMVLVKTFAENTSLSISELHEMQNIVLAYFTAITNYEAYVQKIPTEVVNRASFGHNTNSVAVLGKTIRLNIGIFPEIYIPKVLVPSLIHFNNILPKLLNGQIDFDLDELNRINNDIDLYNVRQLEKAKCSPDQPQKVQTWSAEDSVFELLCKVSDSFGHTLSHQLVRERRYIDLLTNYVLDEYMNWGMKANPMVPLKMVLMHLNYGDEVSLSIWDVDKYNDVYEIPKRDFPTDVNVEETIKQDTKFWKIMQNISSAFEKRSIYILSDGVEKRNMHGIYRLIDEANLELIVNSSDQNCEDGYGSDSDCEIEMPVAGKKVVYRSKKITTATGMRAMYSAMFLVKHHLGIKNFNTEVSYYETPVAVSFVRDTNLNIETEGSSNQTIRSIDLNHCNTCGPGVEVVDLEKIAMEQIKELNGMKSEAIILDYTTATTKTVRKSLESFLPHTKVLLLVNTGLKNEQIGADINPYGVIRIVSDSIETVDHSCSIVKSILTEIDKMDGINELIELPKDSHNIRKCYKRLGATVTSESIFKHCEWNYKKK